MRDANVVLFIRDTPYVAAGFNRFELLNASSRWEWDNFIVQALGTQAPGVFVVTAGTLAWTSCQLIDVGTIDHDSSTAGTATDCIFRGTGQVSVNSGSGGSGLRRVALRRV